ncbi:MAG TPA: mechanosensitive ion channel protein, partial [Ramlibacter sp.]|nr:mechanosensitive ion channel protein [Ramlibacter sp.]
MTNIDELLRQLAHPGLPLELAALAGCLALAFALSWLTGRRHTAESVWFGRSIVDGLLFPLLALVFTYSAAMALRGATRIALLKIAIPVLVSLVGIR